MKICHNCKYFKFKLPLFLFKNSSLKYQLKSDMGKGRTCRFCIASRALNSTVVRKTNGKFVTTKLTKMQILKEFFTL